MKKYIFFSVLIIVISCNQQKTVTLDNPHDYNDALTGIIYTVQIPVDSLEFYLLNTKLRLENTPDSIFFIKDEIDTVLINRLLKNSKIKSEWALEEITYINYFEEDKFFKKSVIVGLKIIDSTINFEFKPLIDTLYSCDGKKYRNVVSAMLPKGQSSYAKYSAAFDTLVAGQQKFDANNNYVLQSNFIRFNF